MKSIRNNKGITLIEIVIAIGIIVVFSGVILQLFITAQNLTQKANDLDESIMAATSIIELFRSAKTPSDIKNKYLLEYTSLEETNDEIKLYMNYDKDWKLLKNSNEEVAFILTAIIKPVLFANIENESANAYIIKISVVKEKAYPMAKQGKKEIYSIEAIRYYNLQTQ